MNDHSTMRLVADTQLDPQGGVYVLGEGTNTALARVMNFQLHDCALADARRLAACWNACQHLTTEMLERGIVADVYPDGVARSFIDVHATLTESAIRTKLIALGWTPPEVRA